MRVEHRVDGFVAERGGLRIDGPRAGLVAVGGVAVALVLTAVILAVAGCAFLVWRKSPGRGASAMGGDPEAARPLM